MKKTFNEKCYDLLRKVPKGRVTTYKEIAQALGTKGYRAVGNAMNKNPYGYYVIFSETVRNCPSAIRGKVKENRRFSLVPCHRVIKSNGEIGGFASGTKNKLNLLKKEGIEIKKGKIDLKKYGYYFKCKSL